jgi:hypothetical protein
MGQLEPVEVVIVELDKQVHPGINERWKHKFPLNRLSRLQAMRMTDGLAAAIVESSPFHKFG